MYLRFYLSLEVYKDSALSCIVNTINSYLWRKRNVQLNTINNKSIAYIKNISEKNALKINNAKIFSTNN